jgi:hypothetical protein
MMFDGLNKILKLFKSLIVFDKKKCLTCSQISFIVKFIRVHGFINVRS